MTFYDKGLLRAMKQAYKGDGYDVALTDDRITIRTENWGIEALTGAVPNSVKSLIVLHNGGLPMQGRAIHVCKSECCSVIAEIVTGDLEELNSAYTEKGGASIKPTRLTMDGCRVWQTGRDLKAVLVDMENQEILTVDLMDYSLIGNALFRRSRFGSLFIRTRAVPAEDRLLLEHLSQMQWIPVEEHDEQ